MVDTDWKNKMMSSESPKLSSKLHVTIPSPFKVVAVSSPISCSAPVACSAYELYLRLPELKTSGHHVTSLAGQTSLSSNRLSKLWRSVSDWFYPFAPTRDRTSTTANGTGGWTLSTINQLRSATDEALSACYHSSPRGENGVPREEVLCTIDNEMRRCKYTLGLGEQNVSNKPNLRYDALSQPSTTSRHVAKTESLGKKILRTIDNEMRRCKYTLGLGEQNISNKPNLRYDAVCKPDEVHGLKDNPYADHVDNYENQTLYILHQILESWIQASKTS
ncbi:hypothetical protein Bca52824_095209 [Brassica carinata]|uniref:Uncharacterized protein n=1 Tax=Brassica carinata TaxID=52824 RepID=A0A8X7P1R9_BRACI|nr:hypothetical protein Bca52824_095209 [Brassica carinata]